MVEYTYRGFKLSYIVQKVGQAMTIFKADGSVANLPNEKQFVSKQFHTEYQTAIGAEQEIKKLLEDYVDFELNTFHEMQKEHEGR